MGRGREFLLLKREIYSFGGRGLYINQHPILYYSKIAGGEFEIGIHLRKGLLLPYILYD